jgi:hypothetical protein
MPECEWCGAEAVEQVVVHEGRNRDLKSGLNIELPIRAWACATHAEHAREAWTPSHDLLRRKDRKAQQTTIFDMPGVEQRLDPMRDA